MRHKVETTSSTRLIYSAPEWQAALSVPDGLKPFYVYVETFSGRLEIVCSGTIREPRKRRWFRR